MQLSMAVEKVPVIIIGSGISGLSCGKILSLSSDASSFLVLDKNDRPGGRIQTDKVNGYLLDRGFQIFIDSYPEVNNKDLLDIERLELFKFSPGALIRYNKAFYKVSDPLRKPLELFEILFTPIGTLVDKIKVGILSILIRFIDLETIKTETERDTLSILKQDIGVSDSIIDLFFKPFYQGIFLGPLEEQSSRMFRFVFKMLATGSGTLPKDGMQAIPQQIADSLPSSSLKLNTLVTKIEQTSSPSSKYIVHTVTKGVNDSKEIQTTYETDNLVIATDAPSAKSILVTLTPSQPLSLSLTSNLDQVVARSSTCLYYGFNGPPPMTDPILVLNGANDLSKSYSLSNTFPPIVNNVCFPSQIAPSYAPAGQSLASVTVVGCSSNEALSEADLDRTVRAQLSEWWGVATINQWTLLKTYRIPYAQPAQKVPYAFGQLPVKLKQEGLYMCGDHIGTATLNGAIQSGRRVAEAIIAKSN